MFIDTTQAKKETALRTGALHQDKITGQMWAQKAIALCMSTASKWTALCHELMGMPLEQRDGALNAWKSWKSAKIKARAAGEEQSPAMSDKEFKRIMATATVRLSHLSTISRALAAGMTTESIANHYKVHPTDVAALSIDSIYQVAKMFSQSKAGRKEKTFTEALASLVEKFQESVADSDAELMAKVVALL